MEQRLVRVFARNTKPEFKSQINTRGDKILFFVRNALKSTI